MDLNTRELCLIVYIVVSLFKHFLILNPSVYLSTNHLNAYYLSIYILPTYPLPTYLLPIYPI